MAADEGDGIGGAFGAYDFFAYILPGALAALPLVYLPVVRELIQSIGTNLAFAFLGLAAAYLLGLAVHAAGNQLERALEKEYPSRRALSKLPSELQTKLRQLLQDHFDLPTGSDGLLWDLANRHLGNKGLSRRVYTFMMLHLVSRGLLIVLVLYAVVVGYMAVTLDWRWVGLYLAIAAMWFLFNKLRAQFNRAVADEVLLSYFAARRSEIDERQTR